MPSFSTLAAVALLVATARASIYVTSPLQSTSCTGGQSCQVTWVENGVAPLLSSIGECTVGIYTGDYALVQSVASVDVSSASSLSFTPSPDAGPNGQYYVVFTSNTISYTGYSATFTLNGMSGTAPSTAPTPGGSSIPAGSSTPGTSPSASGAPTDTTGAVSGTSTPSVSVTTPTGSTSAGTTIPSGSTSPTPTLNTSTLFSSSTLAANSTTTTSPTSTSPTTTSTTTATVTASKTASATPSNAAGRVGSSVSLGGIAALFALTGALAF